MPLSTRPRERSILRGCKQSARGWAVGAVDGTLVAVRGWQSCVPPLRSQGVGYTRFRAIFQPGATVCRCVTRLPPPAWPILGATVPATAECNSGMQLPMLLSMLQEHFASLLQDVEKRGAMWRNQWRLMRRAWWTVWALTRRAARGAGWTVDGTDVRPGRWTAGSKRARTASACGRSGGGSALDGG